MRLIDSLNEIQNSQEFQQQKPLFSLGGFLSRIFSSPPKGEEVGTGPAAHCRPGFEKLHPAFSYKAPENDGGMA